MDPVKKKRTYTPQQLARKKLLEAKWEKEKRQRQARDRSKYKKGLKDFPQELYGFVPEVLPSISLHIKQSWYYSPYTFTSFDSVNKEAHLLNEFLKTARRVDKLGMSEDFASDPIITFMIQLTREFNTLIDAYYDPALAIYRVRLLPRRKVPLKAHKDANKSVAGAKRLPSKKNTPARWNSGTEHLCDIYMMPPLYFPEYLANNQRQSFEFALTDQE